MPQETKSDAGAARGVVGGAVAGAGAERATLQGCSFDLGDAAAIAEALEKAFDYRGDVTLGLAGGGEVSGYIFDRKRAMDLAGSYVRLMTPTDEAPVKVSYAEIRSVSFSGRDAAHGKSFETWVRKYVEKKLAGEAAGIVSESLD